MLRLCDSTFLGPNSGGQIKHLDATSQLLGDAASLRLFRSTKPGLEPMDVIDSWAEEAPAKDDDVG
jgi:hypothetical protein